LTIHGLLHDRTVSSRQRFNTYEIDYFNHSKFTSLTNFKGERQTALTNENAGTVPTDTFSDLMLFSMHVRCAALACVLWTLELYRRASVIYNQLQFAPRFRLQCLIV
jgi:hypothetical protein